MITGAGKKWKWTNAEPMDTVTAQISCFSKLSSHASSSLLPGIIYRMAECPFVNWEHISFPGEVDTIRRWQWFLRFSKDKETKNLNREKQGKIFESNWSLSEKNINVCYFLIRFSLFFILNNNISLTHTRKITINQYLVSLLIAVYLAFSKSLSMRGECANAFEYLLRICEKLMPVRHF